MRGDGKSGRGWLKGLSDGDYYTGGRKRAMKHLI